MKTAVVTCLFNPAGYQAPVRNCRFFLRERRAQGVPTYVVELCYDDEPSQLGPEFGEGIMPTVTVIGRRASREDGVIWQKEALLNVAARRAIADGWERILWVDADLTFSRADWVQRADAELRARPVAQLFSLAHWTGRSGEVLLRRAGSIAADNPHPARAHPGFAWGADASFWLDGPGLFPWGIAGGGDTIMARALMGFQRPHHPVARPLGESIYRWLCDARDWLGGRPIGHLPLHVWHQWHGRLQARGYRERNTLVHGFAPGLHAAVGQDGVVRWSADAPAQMREGVERHFATRDEDGEHEIMGSVEDHFANSPWSMLGPGN
jgi:hypothetical protein